MAYMTIQIDLNPNGASPEVGPSLGDLKVLLGDTAAIGKTKPNEVLQNVVNLIDGIRSGTIAAEISVASSSNADLTVSASSVFGNVLGTGAVNISNPPLDKK